MKFHSFISITLVGAIVLTAAAVHAGYPVHLRPDTGAATIGQFAAGETPRPPLEAAPLTEAQRAQGWEAISFLDNFRGYVNRADLSKDLNARIGALIYARSERDPNLVMTVAAQGDRFEVLELRGEWAEVSFRKPLTGFINRAPAPDPLQDETPIAPTPLIETLPLVDSGEQAQPPEAHGQIVASRAAIPIDGHIRVFEGRLARPRAWLGRGPPYQHQIVDTAGRRIAFLDMSKLLITAPIEDYLNRNFQVFGIAEPIEGRRDFVIRAEHMRSVN